MKKHGPCSSRLCAFSFFGVIIHNEEMEGLNCEKESKESRSGENT